MNVINKFLEYLRVQKRYSDRTETLYSEAVREFYASLLDENWEDECGDELLVKLLTPLHIRSFVAKGLNENISSRTMNLKLSAISSYCNYLVKIGVLESNPAKKVHRPKEDKKLPAFYTEISLEQYIEERNREEVKDSMDFHQYRNWLLILVLYSTGMRRSEAIGLRQEDFDLGRKVVRVVGKGDKLREIPLPVSVCQEILLYLRRIKDEFPDGVGGLFFVTDKGRPIYPVFVDKVVKEELSGVDGFSGRKSPHVLRHSIATHLLNNGANLNSIKELLGHSSLAATQVYTHTSFEQLKNTFLTAHPRAKKRR